MSTQTSLPYAAQRSIIPHLDVHLRIKLSSRCRSLRTLDSILPVKIKYFQMSRNEFKLNNTVYKIGILKVWKKNQGPTPDFVKQQNRIGGYPFDVNEYGLVPNIERDAEFILRLNARLSSKVHQIENPLHRQLDEYIMDSIKLKQEDKLPPYTMYLQVLEISKNEFKKTRLEHNRSIQETKDYIWRKIFGTQRLVRIQKFEVEKFPVPSFVWSTFNPFEPRFHGAPDLPNYQIPCFQFDNRRLEIQHLKLGCERYNFLEAIRPILLGSLKMMSSSKLEDPIVWASELLIITAESQIETLNDIPHPRVHMTDYTFSGRRISTLVTQWKNGRSIIGVHYSFTVNINHVESFLACFERMDEARKELTEELRGTQFPECIIVPLKVDSEEAIVYCEKSKMEDKEYCSSDVEYIIRIKIRGNGRGLGME